MHILLIDDEQSLLDIYKYIFEHHSFKITICNNIEEGYTLLNNDYDFVLLDFHMGADNTLDLIEKFINKLGVNYVGVLSGIQCNNDIKLLKKLNIKNMFVKPISCLKIIDEINEIFS